MAKQLRLLAIYLVLMMIVFSFTMDGTAALNSMFSVLMFMMAINCFAYDEQVHFEKLVAASPVLSADRRTRPLRGRADGRIGGSVGDYPHQSGGRLYPESRERRRGGGADLLLASIGVALLLVSVLFPLFYKFE